MTEDGTEQPQELQESETQGKSGCCYTWIRYEGNEMAQAFAMSALGRGSTVMSNVFLTTSLVYLASEHAGCVDEAVDEVIDDCDGRAFGMDPSALISTIAVISGVLSALFMPLFGAILDYTKYRWAVGVSSAALMMLIQAAQIGTVQVTWFPMAVLQALAGFLYQVQILALFAFLPEVARTIGQETMAKFSGSFWVVQAAAQCVFLVLIVGLSFLLGLADGGKDAVYLAQVSQTIATVWATIGFVFCWRRMPHVQPQRVLPEGQKVWLAGFTQVKNTVGNIYRDYPKSLGLFLLAVVFAEAGANAFTVVAVIYLDERIGLNASDIGIFFLVSLLTSIPGTWIGNFVTPRMNPRNSWRLNLILLGIVASAGAIGLQEGDSFGALIWAAAIGLMLGWHYPCENLCYSVILPKGQDSEVAGFYIYCSQILVWLPPLIFSGLVQSGTDQKWGVVVVASFLFVAAIILSFLPPWEDVIADVSKNKRDDSTNDEEDGVADTKDKEKKSGTGAEPGNNDEEPTEHESIDFSRSMKVTSPAVA